MEKWLKELDEVADQAAERFRELFYTVAALRHPKTGCPWDLKQTHETLIPYLMEECYEAAAAVHQGANKDIIEEFGDVLLQVFLHGQLSWEAEGGSLSDVVAKINEKMRRRHPHVFSTEPQCLQTDDELSRQWQKIKAEEKGLQDVTGNGLGSWEARLKSCPGPANFKAKIIGKMSKAFEFDWHHRADVLDHLRSEIDELSESMSMPDDKSVPCKQAVFEELGDVYFTLCQLSRHLGVSLEYAGECANQKFLKRFRFMFAQAKNRGLIFEELSDAQKESFWQDAKNDEKKEE